MVYLSLIVATVLPLIALYLIYRLDLYAMGSFQTVMACFAWGVAAFAIALFVSNRLVFDWGWVNRQTLSHTVAPVLEEVWKALFLTVLVRRPQFTYFVDGAIYGFAVGMGFAVVENTLYLATNGDLSTALSRVVSTNLMHATATAMVGIALGRARFHRFTGRFLWLLAGLAAAVGIHAGFNRLVTGVNGRFLLLYAALVGLVGLGFIVLVIKRGLAEQKGWIEESLGEVDRVTAAETAVVQRLANVYDILTPLAAQFGAEKAQKIEDFLMLQARLGILRKTLAKLKDDKLRRGVETQIETLRQEIDTARRDVGPYCMVYLRNIFPKQNSPVWPQLEQRISNRPKKPTGTSIWTTVAKRAQSSK